MFYSKDLRRCPLLLSEDYMSKLSIKWSIGRALGSSEESEIRTMLLKFLLAICWQVLWLICMPSVGQGEQFECPQSCNCSALSASCRGDNNTFVNVVKALPANLNSFRFTLSTATVYRKVALDLNHVDELDKFINLRNFALQPESQSKSFLCSLDTVSRKDRFCHWTHLKTIHLNVRILTVNPNMFNC